MLPWNSDPFTNQQTEGTLNSTSNFLCWEQNGWGEGGGGATCYLQQFYELGLAQSCRARYCPGLRPLRRLAPADKTSWKQRNWEAAKLALCNTCCLSRILFFSVFESGICVPVHSWHTYTSVVCVYTAARELDEQQNTMQAPFLSPA